LADVIGNAMQVVRIATGETEDDMPADDGKNQAAVSLGTKGGAARAAKLTVEQRAEIGSEGGDEAVERKLRSQNAVDFSA
jgi:hypothetical protein